MGELLMDSLPITQGLGQKPTIDWPNAKNTLAAGQSLAQELEVSLRSGLYLLVYLHRHPKYKVYYSIIYTVLYCIIYICVLCYIVFFCISSITSWTADRQ